jgi:hypothetical protein
MTAMGKWEFYDESEEVEGADDQEPSFSLYDFKRWLASQGDAPGTFRESVEPCNEELDKEALREEFKNKVRDRVQKNIDRKLAERKKKKR